MAKIAVVADTSPLIGLAHIGLLPMLPELFTTIYVPEAVIREAIADSSRPGASTIQEALSTGILKACQIASSPALEQLAAVLDEGEAEALLFAQQQQIAVLIDERKGRRTAATMGIGVIGTGAVLIEAKQAGLISAVAPCLEQLKSAGYRLSESLIEGIRR